ncbi:MAG TPA: hypothetical protein VFR63_14125 [Gaiellaceae bacterium]|nr:hypothetical protein [Gaiellaceae bacterium]
MAEFPEHLDTGRHRDAPLRAELIARRVLMTLLAGLAVAALFSVFGQSPQRSVAAGERASLEVSAPARLRGGLFYQGRFTIRARAAIENAVLVFAPGWLESTHVNTIVPAPAEETSRDGRLALAYGPLAAGDLFVVYMQFQVNPTNVGRRSADVELYDGDELLALAHRTVTVFP